MPQRPLGLVHAAINGRGLRGIRPRLHLRQDLLPQRPHLGLGLGQRGLQATLERASMRDADQPQRRLQARLFPQQRVQFLGLKRPQDHRHHGQQQKGSAGEGPGATTTALRWWFHIVFFDLLDYPEQGVGGQRVVCHPPTVQRVRALCYPRRIYAQASSN